MIKVLLIVVQGKPEGKTIPIVGASFKIGRGPGCHLRPNSDLVSREHTEITVTDEAATIRDLGSRNGTMLNGRTLTGSAALKSGDLVQIGPLTFAVAIQGAAVEARPSPARPAGAKSLDELNNDQIDSWLIADNNRPTPDRPSGVYDGDTLTLNAYNAAAKPASNAAQPAPAAKPAPAPAVPAPAPSKPAPAPVAATPAAAPVPAPAAAPVPAAATAAAASRGASPFDDVLGDFEQLPEGAGDEEAEAPAATATEEEAETETGGDTDEMIDESNPFFAAKNKKPEEPAKEVFKDTSDAASAILRKMLDRRRGKS